MGRAPNYVGNLPQDNPTCASWEKFYAHFRIVPLIKLLVENGVLDQTAAADRLCRRRKPYFPQEAPVLLHGDLWSENILWLKGAEPALIDPAVYYGHREMDVGMSLFWGGFAPRFYAA